MYNTCVYRHRTIFQILIIVIQNHSKDVKDLNAKKQHFFLSIFLKYKYIQSILWLFTDDEKKRVQ